MGHDMEGFQPLHVVVDLEERGLALDERPALRDGGHRVLCRVEPTVGRAYVGDGMARLQQEITIDNSPEENIAVGIEPGPQCIRVPQQRGRVLESLHRSGHATWPSTTDRARSLQVAR